MTREEIDTAADEEVDRLIFTGLLESQGIRTPPMPSTIRAEEHARLVKDALKRIEEE